MLQDRNQLFQLGSLLLEFAQLLRCDVRVRVQQTVKHVYEYHSKRQRGAYLLQAHHTADNTFPSRVERLVLVLVIFARTASPLEVAREMQLWRFGVTH